MPNAASLRNLRPWKPGRSGNPNGRPRAPRFSERDQHAILTALAGTLGEVSQRAAINAMQAALSNRRTVLKALELCARVNGERIWRPQNSEIGLPKMSRRALCHFRYLRIPSQGRAG